MNKQDAEKIEKLERELAAFQPAALPPELAAQLRIPPPEESLTLSDRVLVLFASTGSLAAAVIAATILWQLTQPAPQGPTAAEIAARQERAAEYQRLLVAR